MSRLMPTLAVAFALAALSLACGFGKYQCKSKQAEMKMSLTEAAAYMQLYRAEHGTYAKTRDELEEAGFSPEETYYEIEIKSATDDTYVIVARGTGDMEGDLWEMDESGQEKPVSDKCN
jgi:Tfp pilus assembly protein PilE